MRPRENNTPLSAAGEAVKALRQHLKMTQQRFAQEVGISINSIARYETGRTPRGRILITLQDLALRVGRQDLYEQFSSALVLEIGIPVTTGIPGIAHMIEPPRNVEEGLEVAVFLLMRRKPGGHPREVNEAWNKVWKYVRGLLGNSDAALETNYFLSRELKRWKQTEKRIRLKSGGAKK